MCGAPARSHSVRRNAIESGGHGWDATGAHDRILVALRAKDADRLAAELDADRDRALTVPRAILGADSDSSD
jgi:hypothetical protein